MSKKHSNISIFVPHIGCPNKCSFCNQRYITGTSSAPNAADVEKAVITAVKSKKYDPSTTEIAFFGGSFTAINRNYMLSLLEAASSFVRIGLVSGIRISTRPDAIDDEILMLLKEYNVTAIELGAQSFNNHVLKMNNRGHTAKDTETAATLIKKYGFEKITIDAEYKCKTWKARMRCFFFMLTHIRLYKCVCQVECNGKTYPAGYFYRIIIPRIKLIKAEDAPGEEVDLL